MLQHEDQRPGGEHHGVGGVHDARAEQHADGVQIVGGARHDVAGAGALVEAVGQRFQMAEQIVAQVEFDFARNADQDPASEELEDGLAAATASSSQGIGQQLVAGNAQVQIIDGAADDQRERESRRRC